MFRRSSAMVALVLVVSAVLLMLSTVPLVAQGNPKLVWLDIGAFYFKGFSDDSGYTMVYDTFDESSRHITIVRFSENLEV